MTPLLSALHAATQQLLGSFTERAEQAALQQTQVAAIEQRAEQLALTEAALATVLADASAASLQAIEQTITYGLQTVFDDRGLAFKLVVSQVRGQQAVEPVLVSASGVQAGIIGSFGGGPASLVAFLLRLIVCHRMQLYPVLLLDEVFSMVSVEYLPNLGKLLRELAEQLGFTFLLVTQVRSFVDHADVAYEVASGPGGTTFREVQP